MTELIAFGAIMTMLLVAFVTHGILRPMLEARGVSPWTAKDSLGSTPLIQLGSGVVGASVAVVGGLITGNCASTGLSLSGAIVATAVGLVMIKLGLLALRKVL